MSAVLVLALGLLAQDIAERPPRPSDNAMLAQLLDHRPDARVVSASFRDTRLGGGRAACGLIDIGGAIEPFALLAAWQDSRRSVVSQLGAPPTEPEPAGWRVSVTAPGHTDHDGDGLIGRGDRNSDTLDRKLALTLCRNTNPITPPDGVRWSLELEGEPDRP
ncbi:MAG: hypothetical protein ACXW3K_09425 [Brevundimonas sp.]